VRRRLGPGSELGCLTVASASCGCREVATADSSGIVKIWDIRNFRCVQQLHVEVSQ